ncbi:hypothetical protein RvY_02992 [Ramazzottius varieornatus]|uniref:Uncharacterized protein n=1 Tax=Ramazzottius varieornatus TaxID=947166 RepID=A0A1D1ULL1_RAMVA|nr:hypothetical protein RvY_02992 [Ramazzottius varieornatus]
MDGAHPNSCLPVPFAAALIQVTSEWMPIQNGNLEDHKGENMTQGQHGTAQKDRENYDCCSQTGAVARFKRLCARKVCEHKNHPEASLCNTETRHNR